MRPNISPLMLAQSLLRASEEWERRGDLDEAARDADKAAEYALAWADAIRRAQTEPEIEIMWTSNRETGARLREEREGSVTIHFREAECLVKPGAQKVVASDVE